MRKKRKRRLGSWKLILALAATWGCLSVEGAAEKGKKPERSTGVLAGTVFSDAGFALRGAPVLIRLAAGEAGPGSKAMEWKVVSDTRGEFAVRVPAGTHRFRVESKAEGFKIQIKEAVVAENERVELNFLLERQTP